MKKTLTLLLPLLLAAGLLCSLPLGAQQPGSAPKINKKNLVIKEWNTDPKGMNKVLDHVTTYNPDGRKVEEIEYNSDGQKWRKRFEYDAAGKVTKEFIYDNRNRLQNYKQFEYNEFGRKKVQYTYNPKGKLLGVKHFEYIAQETD